MSKTEQNLLHFLIPHRKRMGIKKCNKAFESFRVLSAPITKNLGETKNEMPAVWL